MCRRELAATHLEGFENADTSVVIGLPATKIIDLAMREDVDPIVVGTHGRGGLGRLMLGSVADKVIRVGTPCPVRSHVSEQTD